MAVKTASPAPRTSRPAATAPAEPAKPAMRVRRMPLDARAAAAGIMFDANTLCWHRDASSNTLTQITYGSLPKFLDRLQSGGITTTTRSKTPAATAPKKRGRPSGSATKRS